MKMKETLKANENPQQAAEYVEKPESQIKVMWETLRQNKAAVVGLFIIGCLVLVALTVWLSELFGKQILPYDPNYSDLSKSFISPNAEHWFGTDQLGRDMFSRILDGTKISLFVGVAAVAISLTIGVILGAIAGYRGGKTDTVIIHSICHTKAIGYFNQSNSNLLQNQLSNFRAVAKRNAEIAFQTARNPDKILHRIRLVKPQLRRHARVILLGIIAVRTDFRLHRITRGKSDGYKYDHRDKKQHKDRHDQTF
jgi:ABC-type antimicrobial peptide transport system permease subunit